MGKLRDVIPIDDAIVKPMYAPIKHADPIMERYNKECGPVITKPLVEWCTPCLTRIRGRTQPCCGVYKSGVSINWTALELLGKPKRVCIGVTYDEKLALKPVADDDPNGYSVSYIKRGATVGRQGLAKWLIERGVSGLYILEYDDKLKCYIGRGIVNGS